MDSQTNYKWPPSPFNRKEQENELKRKYSSNLVKGEWVRRKSWHRKWQLNIKEGNEEQLIKITDQRGNYYFFFILNFYVIC